MNTIIDLVRPEIRGLRPYRSAEFQAGLVRLNANENPWRPPADTSPNGLNNYPETRPVALTRALAGHYGVPAEQCLVTRGSSEAIDLLIRCFCRPGRDRVVLCPPTFGMYEVYAQVQGAAVINVPLLKDAGFALDVDAIAAEWNEQTRLVFVCSPNNPTGNRIPAETLAALCTRLAGRGVVVVDGAYTEFADEDPTLDLLAAFDNVAILRTLSKAAGLAGIRCGAVLAGEEVVDMLGRILPPFSYPTPSESAALACLQADSRAQQQQRLVTLREERERMAAAFAQRADVIRVWPSEANFLLIEARDPAGFVAAARAGGILVRDFSWDPWLDNAIRITVGSPEQNRQLLAALGDA